jgi:hypothetical protein
VQDTWKVQSNSMPSSVKAEKAIELSACNNETTSSDKSQESIVVKIEMCVIIYHGQPEINRTEETIYQHLW